MIELYDFALSGNCHKVRLLLSLLRLNYRSIPVNFETQEHKSEVFLQMNPFGQVPVLKDADAVIRDSQAILMYLARKYGDKHWLPLDPAGLAEVSAWLATAANEVALGPSRLRLHYKFGRAVNLDESRQIALDLLKILQQHLANRHWLATGQITIADIAVYPYIALAPEGGIELEPYPAILDWLERIQALPAYVDMPGLRKSERASPASA